MRALSIQQPWAWLIVHGYKPVENRDWATHFRGEIAIHAGKKYDAEGERWVRATFPDIPLPPRAELPMGGIVGMATLVGCVTQHASPFFFGPRGFVLDHARPVPLHPCRGALGIYYVDYTPPPPPVDRTARAMLSGGHETPDHRDIDPATGMQRDYVVLSAEERAKGFVRPVRRDYRHSRCGAVTTMGLALAETYARDPGFYGGTFCATCRSHFPVGADGEFTWDGTDLKVGT